MPIFHPFAPGSLSKLGPQAYHWNRLAPRPFWELHIHSFTLPAGSSLLRSALFIGGASKRMGAAKSLLQKGKTTLSDYLATLLANLLGSDPILVGQGPMGSPWENHPKLSDDPRTQGPLAGMISLSRAYPKSAFIILAVDLYFLDEPAIRWLLSKADEDGSRAIWPKFPDRPFGESLAAFYPAQALSAMAAAGISGKSALHRALGADMRWEPEIPRNLRRAFANINRPEDLPCSMLDL